MKEKLNETSFETDLQQIQGSFMFNLALYLGKTAVIYSSALN